MRRIEWRTPALFLLVLALSCPTLASTDEEPRSWVETLNLGFEEEGAKWYLGGEGYDVTVVDDEKHGGEQSLRMTCEQLGNFGVATGGFPVEDARGKRLRLTGYLKTADVEKGYAGLWMRIDGEGGTLGFDNMQRRGIEGTTDWTQYEIVLEVPDEAKAVVFGALLTGDGTVWVDSLEFELLESVPAVMMTVSGVATGPDGAPVAGAHVAFVVPMTDGAAARTVTDDTGRYSVEIETGEYAITANRPGLTAYIKPKTFDPAETNHDLALSSDGVTITGRVTVEADRPVGGVPLKVYRISEDVADIFYTETDDDGRYAATLPEGEGYVAWLHGDDYIGEPAQIGAGGEKVLDLEVVRRAAAADEIIGWIKSNAVPLATAEAGHGFDDMEPLREIVGNARVVALGEATHGTREFFQLKHRMLEFLVEQMGFTIFAIEANWPEALAINDYVLHGKGNAKEALAGIYFWTWDTAEVLELIEWMRRYNEDPEHDRKIKFYGFDMQFTPVAASEAVDYLRMVDSEYADVFDASIEPLKSKSAPRDFTKLSADERKALADSIDAALERLDGARDDYIEATSEHEWEIGRQHVVILQQAAAMYRHGERGGGHDRDRAMADNVEWILETEPPGTKIVAWAHNGHVSFDPKSPMQPMGMHLERSLGDDYVVFGFAFNRGSFQAIDWTQGRDKSKGLQEHTVGPAPDGNIGAELARTGLPIFVLDLRAPAEGSPPARWFAAPHPMRQTGAIFINESGMSYPIVLPAHYDCIIFVDETTRAIPVEREEATGEEEEG